MIKRVFTTMVILFVLFANFNWDSLVAETIDTAPVDYRIILPDDYDTYKNYPVLYLMPEDGISSHSEEMLAMILDEINTNQTGDFLIVMPEFDLAEDFRVTMDRLVTYVDQAYKTIPTVDQRAILGVGIGGYMAYMIGLTDVGSDGVTILEQPQLIKNIGSIHGNFTGTDNFFYDEYGDVYEIINTIGRNNITNYYTYLDGPTENPHTSMENSTNDIGALFINWFTMPSYDFHEYTARYGEYDASFLNESVNRVVNRFSKQVYSDLISGEISLSPQVAASSVEEISLAYELTISDDYERVSLEATDLLVEVTVTDPNNGEILHTDHQVLEVDRSNTVGGTFTIPNLVNGINSNVHLTAELFGFQSEIGTESLVRIMDTGTNPDQQLIDLMGDWKFNAYKHYSNTGTVELDNINNLTKEIWENWNTVQPALGWWAADFDESLDGNANWTGYAWYVREFDMPENFQTEDLILALGKFDEADEVYINNVFIGSTGMTEPGGVYDRTNPWDVDRVYDLDSSILNYGGKNTIAVRMANSDGGGGWYEGPVGIFTPSAYNKIIGLPSQLAEESIADQLIEFVSKQNQALEAKDIDAFARTVAVDYFQSGYNKSRLINKMKSIVDGEGEVTISDRSVNVYYHNDLYVYQAERTIITADGEEIVTEINDYYSITDQDILFSGNHSRFYLDNYPSFYAASAQDLAEAVNMDYRIYLPDGYFDSNQRYPVVYLLHQFNSTSKSYEIDGVDELLDKGMASGEIQDMIVVIPDSSATSFWSGDWELMVTEELVPFINENYRTIADSRFNGTAGASMGGQGAYGVGLRNPNLFSSIISFFGAFSYGGPASPNKIVTEVSNDYLQYFSHYFISGNRDSFGFGTSHITLDKQLRQKETAHLFEIENGEHDSAFYIPYFIDAFKYTSDHMFQTGGVIGDHASGELEASIEDDLLSVSVKLVLDDSFDQWLNQIPESTYTEEKNPEMIIPLTYQIIQDGKIVFTELDYPTVAGTTTIDLEKEIKIGTSYLADHEFAASDVNLEQDFTLIVFASILDTNKELGIVEFIPDQTDTPEEGQEKPTEEEVISDDDEKEVPVDDEVIIPIEDDQSDEGEADQVENGEIETDTQLGSSLPKTATIIFNFILVGAFLITIGLIILLYKKRAKAS